jgi:hypothetical protein
LSPLFYEFLDPSLEERVRWNGPSVGTGGAVLELDPVAAIAFVEVIYTRAAAVVEEMTVQWRSLTQCSDGVKAEVLPVTWLRPYSRSGLEFVDGECGSGEPRALSRRPPPPFIAQGDGALQP